MRRAKRNAAKLLSAAMAVGMMAGMAVPAAAEEESTNIWASDVDTSEPMELKMYLIGDRTPDFDEAAYMKFLPSAGIRRADGEALIEKMAAGEMFDK